MGSFRLKTKLFRLYQNEINQQLTYIIVFEITSFLHPSTGCFTVGVALKIKYFQTSSSLSLLKNQEKYKVHTFS